MKSLAICATSFLFAVLFAFQAMAGTTFITDDESESTGGGSSYTIHVENLH